MGSKGKGVICRSRILSVDNSSRGRLGPGRGGSSGAVGVGTVYFYGRTGGTGKVRPDERERERERENNENAKPRRTFEVGFLCEGCRES